MFTGIVREIGTVKKIERGTDIIRFGFDCPLIRPELHPGDSVAIDGCDLTVVNLTDTGFTADATKETLKLTTFGDLSIGSKVNLEPSLTPSTPISGHFVLGHIDGVGKIRSLKKTREQAELVVAPPKEILKFIARKGSITISGVGLTVVDVTAETFSVWLIPYTLEYTTLGVMSAGSKVNLEVDVLARYVIRAIESGVKPETSAGITEEFLREHGFG